MIPKININTEPLAKLEEQVVSEPQVALTSVPTIKTSRNPSDWKIEAKDNTDEIVAYDNTSRQTFTGTIADFNILLRS